jgi:hypothetical protein
MGKSLLPAEAAQAGTKPGFVVGVAAAEDLEWMMPLAALLRALRVPPGTMTTDTGSSCAADLRLWMVETLRARIEGRAAKDSSCCAWTICSGPTRPRC